MFGGKLQVHGRKRLRKAFELACRGLELPLACFSRVPYGSDRRFERLDAAMTNRERDTHRISVEARERAAVSDHPCAFEHAVVLHVPSARPLRLERTPLAKALALAVRLTPNRIMPKNES